MRQESIRPFMLMARVSVGAVVTYQCEAAGRVANMPKAGSHLICNRKELFASDRQSDLSSLVLEMTLVTERQSKLRRI